MKKVININFQGRVIPIEETAYELLKQYIESLRIYFANEEGRDEIIGDIEGRMAELFSERLKSGLTCITDEDVNAVIASMGRPEDFAAEEGDAPRTSTNTTTSASASTGGYQKQAAGRGRLYRNADDKILAGVCSGLANYLGIDPVIMRIVFVVFIGVLFWVYIVLWIIVPSKSVESNITKRLYRSADQRVLGGVAGGIAAYFNIDVWIPRLIFALPFIIGLISSGFNAMWFNGDFGFAPRVISGSFGGTLFITYIILWIAVPVAHTAAEKLEMRGERVNLNSIANTVKEDLEQFKVKAEKWSEDVKASSKNLGKQVSSQAKTFSEEAGHVARQSASGLGHAIGVLFRALFIFVFAICAVTLFGVFIFLLFGGIALAPLKDFVFEGNFQNALAWMTLFLVFMIPLIALVTWGVRRIVGVRSKKHYVGYTFAGLWLLGIISGILLFVSLAGNFRNTARLQEQEVVTISGKDLVNVQVEKMDWKKYDNEFFGMDVDAEWPWFTVGDDSIMVNTVKLNMVKSNDSSYHVYIIRQSRGNGKQKARTIAEKIEFNPLTTDSIIKLPRGFFIDRNTKFRNQRVLVVFEIPVNKRVKFDRDISFYNWFSIEGNHNGYYYEDDWENVNYLHEPEPGGEYQMNADGKPQKIIAL